MSPFEMSSQDDVLTGEDTDVSCAPEASIDVSQALTPSSLPGGPMGTNSLVENQTDAPPAHEEPTHESPEESESGQSSERNPPELSSATANAARQTSEEPEEGTTDDTHSFAAILTSVGQIEQKISIIADASVKTVGEVRDMHKLYHNEFANRLKSMQDELERYREIDRGRIYDGILGEIAKLYSDNESVLDDIADARVAKRIRYLLMDIVQLLEANGVQLQKSNVGDRRNARYCQVIERIPTDDPKQHDTVAQSRSAGFYKENRPLVKELVDIYLYSEKPDEQTGEK